MYVILIKKNVNCCFVFCRKKKNKESHNAGDISPVMLLFKSYSIVYIEL